MSCRSCPRAIAQAIEQLRSGIELDPTYRFAHYFPGRAYEQKGRLPEAIAEFQRAVEQTRLFPPVLEPRY